MNPLNPPIIKGIDIDPQGRCKHWHSTLDIIAIKFPCCDEFYACYDCHQEAVDHEAKRWPEKMFDTAPVILCGACKTSLTISQYMNCGNQCPHCTAPFNPRCALHWGLYFDIG